MIHNRISTYMQPPKKRRTFHPAPQPQTVFAPPPNFAPVPVSMLAIVPESQISWQRELYRMAYEAAKASVAATRAADSHRWN
jgi:hypothetical protein